MASRRPALGLRQRLMLALIVPLSIVFTVGVFSDYRLARQTAEMAFDQSLADSVLDIGTDIQTRGKEIGVALSAEAEAMLRNDPADKVYYAIHDRLGHLLAGDSDLPLAQPDNSSQTHFHDLKIHGSWTRVASQRIKTSHGEITITVAETMRKRNHASIRIMTAMILPNLGVILATLLAVYVGVRRGLLPLVEIEHQIASRSPRDLREIDTETTPGEIRPMLTCLNELFGLLREASAAQQRFLADAAHQLRTPLAGLQTQIELATVEGRFQSDPERLARIEDATDRISHLVNQLLIYARAEPATAAAQTFEPVALHALAEQSASVFLDRALAKEIDLGFDIAPATILGLPWMLREALGNLIDNALNHTPRGGMITVRSGLQDGQAFIEVEDNGPGIPPDEAVKVFERFYRIAGSQGEGCGLGLAIVREIATLHGAKVLLRPGEEQGLRACILFPASSS